MRHFKTSLEIFIYSILVVSCNMDNGQKIDYNILSNLPIDTGGTHVAIPHQSTDSPYGYYIYTPASDIEEEPEFPLLIFLHGSGERGNSFEYKSDLELVLVHGPPKLIENKDWKPSYPMIVASPQCHDGGWGAEKIHRYIAYLIDNYKVNDKRIYMTGLSMGGFGTFSYVGKYGDNGYVSASVPICGEGNHAKAKNFINIPTWAFHGDEDDSVPVASSISMISEINKYDPQPRAKLTIYNGVDHDSWSKTYDCTGMGTGSIEYDSFNQCIYDWMFEFQKEN